MGFDRTANDESSRSSAATAHAIAERGSAILGNNQDLKMESLAQAADEDETQEVLA